MTDAQAEHPPVSYQARPDVELPPLVSRGRRRSTAIRPKHPRRGRWITVFGFAGLVLVLGIIDLVAMGAWVFFAACLAFAAVTCTTQYLAEADIALAKVRADAEKRARHAAEKDARILNDHFEHAHDIIRHNAPELADDLLASLNLDLLRSRNLTSRIESDSR